MTDARTRLGALATCAALAAGALAGCSSDKPGKVVTVTVAESTPPPVTSNPAPTAVVPATTTASPSSSTTTTAGGQLTKLNGTCETLLPDDSIAEAIGGTALPGTDAFVVGQPDPNIHRISYLNCRYGITGEGAAASPGIEIGISLYDTATAAANRISATSDDYTAHGASASDTTVDGHPGTLLTGGVGAGYDVPLLVVASGQRTVAVSVAESVATGDAATRDAKALATLALHRTGG